MHQSVPCLCMTNVSFLVFTDLLPFSHDPVVHEMQILALLAVFRPGI